MGVDVRKALIPRQNAQQNFCGPSSAPFEQQSCDGFTAKPLE
jgi:hypothetical protein